MSTTIPEIPPDVYKQIFNYRTTNFGQVPLLSKQHRDVMAETICQEPIKDLEFEKFILTDKPKIFGLCHIYAGTQADIINGIYGDELLASYDFFTYAPKGDENIVISYSVRGEIDGPKIIMMLGESAEDYNRTDRITLSYTGYPDYNYGLIFPNINEPLKPPEYNVSNFETAIDLQ